MAWDPSSLWFGWHGKRAKAMLKVTTQGGDSGQNDSDPQGQAWAGVVALTGGTADEAGPLGSSNNPLQVGVKGLTNTQISQAGLNGSTQLLPVWAALSGYNNIGTSVRIASGSGQAAGQAEGLSVEEAGRAYSNITTATTTTVKNAKGNLHAITFNTQVANATVTLYDSLTATGAKIGTITLPATVGEPFTLPYDVQFGTGLTIVTSAAVDITVAYR